MPSLPRNSQSSPYSPVKQAWASVRAAINGSDPSSLAPLTLTVLSGYRRRRIYFAFVPSGMGDGRQTVTLSLLKDGEIVWQSHDILGNTFAGPWTSTPSSTGWFDVLTSTVRRADMGGLPAYACIRAPSSAEQYPGPCSQTADCVQFHTTWRPTGATGGEECWQVVCHPLSLYCDANSLQLSVSKWSYGNQLSAPAQEYFMGCLSDP